MKTLIGFLLLGVLSGAAQAAPSVSLESQALDAARAFSPAPPAPAFQARSPWQELAEKVVALGVFRDDEVLPANYGLEDVRGDKAAAHQADYVNVWGSRDASGRFQAGFLTFVSEDWAVDAQGRWRISQWTFSVGLDGTIAEAGANLIVETRDNAVVEYQPLARRPQDADVLAKRQELLQRWLSFGRR